MIRHLTDLCKNRTLFNGEYLSLSNRNKKIVDGIWGRDMDLKWFNYPWKTFFKMEDGISVYVEAPKSWIQFLES